MSIDQSVVAKEARGLVIQLGHTASLWLGDAKLFSQRKLARGQKLNRNQGHAVGSTTILWLLDAKLLWLRKLVAEEARGWGVNCDQGHAVGSTFTMRGLCCTATSGQVACSWTGQVEGRAGAGAQQVGECCSTGSSRVGAFVSIQQQGWRACKYFKATAGAPTALPPPFSEPQPGMQGGSIGRTLDRTNLQAAPSAHKCAASASQMALQESEARQQLVRLQQLRGAGQGGLPSTNCEDSRPDTPWTIQVCSVVGCSMQAV
eukprot:scaffold65791_cov19-Tisochrysis_lutea.AAC.1